MRRGTTLPKTDPIREFAPAKVNLCLHVTGQRADGYHLLDSLVVFAGIGDWLEARVAATPLLSLAGPFGPALPQGEDNLVLRAARVVMPDLPLAFRLEKHLPPASGIGGGSSDAAAAIRATLRLAGTRPDAAEIARLAAGLGADVPVCLNPGPARMRGIGEIVEPLAGFPSGGILLVNPGVEVPTPAVFRALAQRDNPAMPDVLPSWPNIAALAAWARGQRNDLEPPAREIAPAIGTVLAVLARLPGALMARMSGSGATCFALFADETAAAAALPLVAKANPAWWAKAGPILSAQGKAQAP
ncbi:4-(cytidine 5'-diphospho)-2-C-methyl-D-erythritol kinase [Pseudogemmobacter bohemicus]|uniref:4-(cytidine 5'-diphospho)-2-C-methyl-D-erythritol kinase n=1 Tax=Pseudogemmobacter bohemicus TaxID=2250708 RepID=UPI001E4CA35D|nr:4-(cytidine 5'-diphospho)-2-C-methyl-D-erythritol kinase [Pseudogemmobacter bohemicus]